ncbi:MAG: GspB domain-containing protein, partial [Gammaproteobacteria bacterium]|nr:GspB domain-containing protein [Gammaproteobacteria bacterium]
NGAEQRERAPFRLQSILLAPERRIAIIDGQRLRVGDRLDNAEVRAIEPGRVVLERAGERIELNIDTHLTNANDGSR